MRIDKRVIGIALGYGIPLMIYWTGGGALERNLMLGFTMVVGSILAGAGFYLGYEWERVNLQKCIDKYRQ